MRKIKCPCCGNFTIEELFDICEVCFWEYDEVAHDKPNTNVGGANKVSLNEAIQNYKKHGVSEECFLDSKLIRKPRIDELPKNNV